MNNRTPPKCSRRKVGVRQVHYSCSRAWSIYLLSALTGHCGRNATVRRPSFTLLLDANWKLQTTPLNDHLLWSHICPTASGFILPRSCFYPPQSIPHIWRGNLCSPPTRKRTGHHICSVPVCIVDM